MHRQLIVCPHGIGYLRHIVSDVSYVYFPNASATSAVAYTLGVLSVFNRSIYWTTAYYIRVGLYP